MRKYVVLLALLALSLPVVATGALSVGDGTLTVEDGRGTVAVRARGGVIGKLERGSVTIFDLTPEDPYDQIVSGDDLPVRLVGETGITYSGTGLRYRIVGGGFRIVVKGRGIHLSAVGKGSGAIQGEPFEPGLYSLEGDDCRKTRQSCLPLPELTRRFVLGTPGAQGRAVGD
jgi:hypothetical protein